jgi:hypothetical protein
MKSTFANLFPGRNQFMKTEIETTETAVSRILRLHAGTAPSLRVPVTADNRAVLRLLRAAELAAWEAGCACGRRYFPARSEPSQNRSHV